MRFQRAMRNPCNFSNFRDGVAFDVVQLDDELMFVAEPFQRGQDPRYGEFALGPVLRRGLDGWRVIGFGRQDRIFDQCQPARFVAPLVVDELVVHHAAEPGANRFDLGKAVHLRMQLQQYVLHQVLCILAMPGQSVREPIQSIEVRTYERCK